MVIYTRVWSISANEIEDKTMRTANIDEECIVRVIGVEKLRLRSRFEEGLGIGQAMGGQQPSDIQYIYDICKSIHLSEDLKPVD